MNKLRNRLTKKRMFFTLIGTFTAMLVMTFVINIVFYYQESCRQSSLVRSFLIESFQTSLNGYESMMSNIQQDTELLFDMPGLDSFCNSGDISENEFFYLQTYAQSRYAIDGIAYYREDTQTLIGYQDTVLLSQDDDTIQEVLALSDEAWEFLLAGDHFIFTEGAAPHVVVSTRIASNVVCLRTISYETTLHSFQFISPKSQSSELFPAWSVHVTDLVGQGVSFGAGNTADYGYQESFDMNHSTGFHFVLQISDDVKPAVWRYITHTLLYYGSALLILGFMFIDIAVSKLYRPVQHVLDSLPSNFTEMNGSEHDCIQKAIRILCDQQVNAENQLQELMQQNFLQRSIIGNIIECEDMDTILGKYHLAGRFDRFAIFQITSPNPDLLSKSDISQFSSGSFETQIILRKNCLLLLLVSAHHADDFDAFGRALFVHLGKEWGITPRISRSNVHCSVYESNKAYLECCIAAEKKNISSSGDDVAVYKEPDGKWPEEFGKSILNSMEQQIYQAVLSHRFSEAQDLFDQYCQRLSSSIFSLQIQKVMVISLCMHLLSTSDANWDGELFSEADLIGLLSPQISGDVFWKSIKGVCHVLLSPMSEKSLYSEHFGKLIHYVQENLSSTSLCATEVANTFCMSASALTREFQKNLGMGFSNYLHIQRIQKAKMLLEQTPKSIKDIANEVGYSNPLTMTRAFKKYEGTTPGAYRGTQTDV